MSKNASRRARKETATGRERYPRPSSGEMPRMPGEVPEQNVPGANLVEITHEERHRRIQKKAYELYEQRGYLPGDTVADWYAAERMVDEEVKRAGQGEWPITKKV